jgi:hypothetical protein
MFLVKGKMSRIFMKLIDGELFGKSRALAGLLNLDTILKYPRILCPKELQHNFKSIHSPI